MARASSGRSAAERLADQRLGGDRVGVEHQREEEEQLQRDLVRAERRRAGAGGDAGGDEERQLQDRGAQQQVAADDQLRRDGRGTRPPAGALPHEGTDEQARGERLPGHVGDRRAHETQPGRVHQQRAEHEADQVPAST